MKKLIMLILIIVTMVINMATVMANSVTPPTIYIRVESYNKTFGKGYFTGYTVKEVFDKVGIANEMDIIYNHINSTLEINSINSIENQHFSEFDGWNCYIVRDDKIIQPTEYLTFSLLNDDKVVIYYGDINVTEIPVSFTAKSIGDKIEYTLCSEDLDPKNVTKMQGVDQARVYVEQPRGQRNIATTNQDGLTFILSNEIGMYQFYADKYTAEGVPELVKTELYYFFYGIDDVDEVSRIEALSFIVNLAGLDEIVDADETNSSLFSDIPTYHKFYSSVAIGTSNGIVLGDENGNFLPDDTVTMLQLAVMLGRLPIFNDVELPINLNLMTVDDVPSWAKEFVYKININSILLDNIDIDWNGYVTQDVLEQIYFNYQEMINSDLIDIDETDELNDTTSAKSDDEFKTTSTPLSKTN